MQMPSFQTWAGKKATALLNKHIDGTAQIDRVMIVFFNKIIIKDAVILGTPGDTLASINKLSVSFSPTRLLRGDLHLNRISIRGGSFRYQVEDQQGMSNVFRIFRIPNMPAESDSPMVFPRLGIGELRIRDFRFALYDPFVPKIGDPECIDFSDLDLSGIDIRASRIEMGEEGMFAQVHSVKALDKSGFEAVQVKGSFAFYPGKEARIEDLYVDDGISQIHADYLSFGFRRGSDWGDFLDRIVLGADFHDSYLDFKTLGKISPELKNNPLYLHLDGRVSGPVRRMTANNLQARYQDLDLLLQGTVSGLPAIGDTDFSLQIDTACVNTHSLEQLITCFSPDFTPGTLADFAQNTMFGFKGQISGTLDNLLVAGSLRSDIGGADTRLLLGNLLNGEAIRIDGTLQTYRLGLDRLLSNAHLGDLSASVDAQLILPQDAAPEILLRRLDVGQIGLLGYDYTRLHAEGSWRNNAINLKAICHDPNLEFLVQAYMANNQDNSRSLKLFLDAPIVDLSALKLDQRGSVSQASMLAMADLTQTANQDWLGSIELKQLDYTNQNGKHPIGDIVLISTLQEQGFHGELISPMLNASLVADDSPMKALAAIRRILLEDQFQTGQKQPAPESTPNLNFQVKTADTRSLCQIFLPELYVAQNTSLNLSLSDTGAFSTQLQSDAIAIGDKQIRNLKGSLTNPDSLLVADIRVDALKMGGIDLQYAQVGVTSDKGLIHSEIGFANATALRNELFLSADLFFDRSTPTEPLKTWIYVNDSYFFLQDDLWDIRPFTVCIGDGEYLLDNLFMTSDKQAIIANGKLGHQENHQMALEIQNLDLSAVNTFFMDSPQIKGILNGKANLSSLLSTPNLFIDLVADGAAIGENIIGTLNIKSKWDQTHNRLNLLLDQEIDGLHPLNIYGHYQPSNQFLNLNADLQGLSLKYLNPFLKDVLLTSSGSLSGNLKIAGRTDRLSLTGENCRFNQFVFTPVYTGVPYILEGDFSVAEGEITFDRIYITDSKDSRARLEGSITHRYFNDIYLDTKLSFQNFQCLNTTAKDNDTFYGTANASGNVALRGTFNDLQVEFTAATADQTSIHVPLSSSLSATQTELLTFNSSSVILEKALEEQLEIHAAKIAPKSNIQISGRATVNSDAEILIEINEETGDIIRSKGSGNIDIDINPARDILNLRGDYRIQEGSYRFVLLGMVAKDFVIEDGGTVTFGGGIADTRVNLKANYNTKASISTLISDTTSVGTRRDVVCGIAMTGSLLNPEISFNIEVPDLDPITKGRVESALSTEDKVLRQTISLLLSGSFLPDEQSGIVNTSTLLYSYTSEMVSNQLNNIFRQLNIPVDLGLNYQQDMKGEDIFDVSLSTQFFNNRVILNGNVGNNTNHTETSSNWMGNLDTEIKLSKDGRIRLTLFTHSADDYSNYLDNTQRTGFGFSFQDEFNSLKELWRNLVWKKKREEEYELQQLLKAEQELIREQEEIKKRQQINTPKESPYQFLGF